MAGVLTKHYIAILFAAAAVVMIYLPQFWLKNDSGADYQGIYYGGSDSELYYAGRIHDIYDGNLKTSNAFLAEYKNLPYIQPPLPEIILAGLGYLSFSSDVAFRIFFATRVVLPFLLFLSVYTFIYRFTRSRAQGLLGAVLIFFGIDLLQNPKGVLNFLQFQFPNTSPVVFSRPVSPQMGMLFFFGYASLFWEWLKTKRNIFLYSTGIVLGFSVYIYFYTWTFVLAGNGFLGLYWLFTKSFTNFKKLVLLHITALLVAIPYLFNVFAFFSIPNREQLGLHVGMFSSRNFFMNWSAIVGLAASILVWFKDRQKQIWFASLMLGGFFAVNQQVFTGQELTPAHFHWYFIAPVFGLIGLMAFFKIFKLESRKILKLGIVIILVGFLFTSGVIKQQKSYAHYGEYYKARQRYGVVYDWLNDNTATDSVVLVADRDEGDNITAFTHNNAYFSSFMFLSNTPQERLADMHYLEVMLEGVSEKNAEQFFRDNPNRVADLLGGFSIRRIYGCRTCFPEEEYTKAVSDYQKYLEDGLPALFNKYQLDYIVIDLQKDVWSPKNLSEAERVLIIGDFEIYRYNKE